MTSRASHAVSLCGTDQVDPPLRPLSAGPLQAFFDNGAIRYVRIGGVEVLRGIAFLVRDENWGTFTPQIEDLSIDEGADRFSVRYRGICADASRRLVYEAEITGRTDGSLSFVAKATPETDVLTNRTGFIVLHPIADLAGKPVKVLHEDGTRQTAAFPDTIDPKCPFTGIRALSHEIAPGVWATCAMEGEAFEMEDQRNWTDASYKTYVRSLKKPWPYTLPKGQAVTQAIHLTLDGAAPPAAARSDGAATRIVVAGRDGTVPRLGIGVPAKEAQPALDRPDLMRRLAPQVLVGKLDLRFGQGREDLERYAALAALTGAGLVLEIITRGTLDPAGELRPVADAVQALGLLLEAVSVFPAQDMKSVQPGATWPEMPSFAETYAAARAAFPGVTLGGGMAAYFTELNRKRPPQGLLDYVTFTTCPNVHAADDVSVMETLESLPHLVRSTRAFMGETTPIRIGPSQLGCRENAYGSATAPNPDNQRVCLSRIDPRQRGLFNAAWTLGYVAACARSGVHTVALGAPTGSFGLIHRAAEFVQPWYDDRDEGGNAVYSAFHVMAGLTGLAGSDLLSTLVDGAPGIEALAAQKDGRTVLWIANLTADTRQVQPERLAGTGRISVLAAKDFERAAVDPDFMETAAAAWDGGPVLLDAYAVARMELD